MPNVKGELMNISYEIYSKDNEITFDDFFDKVANDGDFFEYFDNVLWKQAEVIHEQRQKEYNEAKTNVNPPSIKYKYRKVLNQWDVIVDKKLFHEYNKDVPVEGNFIKHDGKNYTITKIVDDSESYLIKWEG